MQTRMLGGILLMIAASAGAQGRKGVQVQPKPAETQKPASVGVVLTPLRVIQAIAMTDGTIRADFGFGLETVTRSCPSEARTMPLQIIGVSELPDPTRQPIPGLTPEQRKMSKEAAQASCFVRDDRGRFFATR